MAYAERTENVSPGTEMIITDHARQRMGSRKIGAEDVGMVLRYGRKCHVRGALVYAVGRREVRKYRRTNLRLEGLEGVHVVCALDSEAVITVYRNCDLSDLKGDAHRFFGRGGTDRG